MIVPRILRAPWTQQPPPGTALQIDWTNPLTRGLILAVVGGQPNDLVSGVYVPGGSNTGPVGVTPPVPYAGGMGVPAGAAVGFPYYGIPGGIPPDASNWTCLTLATLYSGATYQTDYVVGWAGEISAGFAIGVAFSTAIFRSSIAGTNISHAVSLMDNREHLLGVSLGGGTGRAWKDGVQVASASCSTPTFSFAQNYTRFAVGSDSMTAGYKVPVGLTLLYSRELSAVEHAQLARNPWQLFATTARRVWVPVGAGGGVTLAVANATHAHIAGALTLSIDSLLSVASATHAHAADNLALGTTGATSLAVADASHAHAAESPALTLDTWLAVDDAAHAHTADNVTLSTLSVLAIADALHGHSADNLALTLDTWLVIADVLHAHVAENATLDVTGSTTLSIADATHTQLTDSLDLTSAHALTIADVLHGHSADNLTLTLDTWLVINEVLHAHAVDNVVLSQNDALNLVVQNSQHAHTSDAIELTSQLALVIADVAHLHESDALTLSTEIVLAIQNAMHLHTSANVVLIIPGEVIIDEITGIRMSTPVILAQLTQHTYSVRLHGSHLQ